MYNHDHIIDTKYPIFYKMRQNIDGKIRLVSGIEIALESNQIGALNLMIQYIIEHQNNFCYFNLFNDNLLELFKKGIKLAPLLESDIFCHRFEEPDWPIVHIDNSSMIKPYNGSIFNLNGKYKAVFGEDLKKEQELEMILNNNSSFRNVKDGESQIKK